MMNRNYHHNYHHHHPSRPLDPLPIDIDNTIILNHNSDRHLSHNNHITIIISSSGSNGKDNDWMKKTSLRGEEKVLGLLLQLGMEDLHKRFHKLEKVNLLGGVVLLLFLSVQGKRIMLWEMRKMLEREKERGKRKEMEKEREMEMEMEREMEMEMGERKERRGRVFCVGVRVGGGLILWRDLWCVSFVSSCWCFG